MQPEVIFKMWLATGHSVHLTRRRLTMKKSLLVKISMPSVWKRTGNVQVFG